MKKEVGEETENSDSRRGSNHGDIQPQQSVFISFWKPEGCGSEFLPFCACEFMFG